MEYRNPGNFWIPDRRISSRLCTFLQRFADVLAISNKSFLTFYFDLCALLFGSFSQMALIVTIGPEMVFNAQL